MDDNDTYDFTFCKVDSEVVNTQVESPKAIPDVNKISFKDSFSDDKKNYDSSQDKYLFPSLPKNIAAYNGFSFGGSNGMPQPYLKSNESLAIEAARVDGSSVIGFEREKLEPRKPIVRAKVPFEKGYSQMDWLKLTQTHPDLAELRGQTNKRLIAMDEVKKHKIGGSIWTVLKGRVYNISPYMKFHPGGVDMLSKAAGKDCTLLFNKYHAWVNAEFLLEKCLVGVLDFEPSSV